MPAIPALRSPYVKLGRLVHLGRMLDKIRLHAAGKLPEAYVKNLGDHRPNLFDARLCRFLGVEFEAVQDKVLAGHSDDEVVAWIEEVGDSRTDDECNVWNRFMMKIGWRDDRSAALQERVQQYGLEGRGVETFFDLIEYDEGRDPAATKPWLQ